LNDTNTIIEEEQFERVIQPIENNSKILVNEFFNREKTLIQHPNLSILSKENNKNKYSELFSDQFITTIYLKGNLNDFRKLDEAHFKNRHTMPSMNVTATFITPYSVMKYKNLLLEINTFADLINTDIYQTANSSNTYYFKKNRNPKKSSYFLTYKNYTSPIPLSSIDQRSDNGIDEDSIFNRTSIQLLSTSTDNLLIRNKMYTDLCHLNGIPSAQVAYTRIYFNDIPLGFYLIKENPTLQYFIDNFNTSEMYSQVNTQYAPMKYVGDFNITKADPKLLNNATTDNYSNYWYQGIEKPKTFHAKNDLVSLFKIFEKPTSIEEIDKIFKKDIFIKNMALDYIVNNEHGYLYNGTNYFLFYDTVSIKHFK